METPTATPTPPPAVESVAAGNLAAAALPPVNEHAIRGADPLLADPAAGSTQAAATPKPPANLGRDALGREFDAQKFRPEKDALGRWKNLRGGRKPGSKAPAPTPPAASGSSVPLELIRPTPTAPTAAAAPQTPAAPAATPEEYAATAEGYIALGVPIVGAFVGDEKEWEPDDNAERERIRNAISDYLRASGIKPATPLGRLCTALGGYVWKRLTRPKTAKFIASRWPTFAGLLGIPVEHPRAKDPEQPPAEKPAQPPPAAAPRSSPFDSIATPRP